MGNLNKHIEDKYKDVNNSEPRQNLQTHNANCLHTDTFMKSKVDEDTKYYPKLENKDNLKKKKLEEEVSVGLRGHRHKLVVGTVQVTATSMV